MTADEATRTLATLIGAKRDCLRHLRALVRTQNDAACDRDGPDFMTALAGKRRLLARLRSIEQALDPFRRQRPDERVWRSDAARRQCAEQLAECDALWAEIVERETDADAAVTAPSWNTFGNTDRDKGIVAPSAARASYAVHSSEGPGHHHIDSQEGYAT